MEVVPRNTAERIFVIMVVIGALLVFSTFVSSITNAMTHLRQYNAHKYDQLETITRYLVEKRVSLELSNRIAVFMKRYKFLDKRRVREEDVEVFTVLPTSLKRQLRLEAHGPILARQPVFFQLSEFDKRGLLDICNSTITELSLCIAGELFLPGQDAMGGYFFLHGHAEYTTDEATWELAADSGDRLFCEAALWIRLQHRGRLFCRTAADMLLISSASFRRVVPKRLELHKACCEYAKMFLAALIELDADESHYDLGLGNVDQVREMAQRTFESAFKDAPGGSGTTSTDTSQSSGGVRRLRFQQRGPQVDMRLASSRRRMSG